MDRGKFLHTILLQSCKVSERGEAARIGTVENG